MNKFFLRIFIFLCLAVVLFLGFNLAKKGFYAYDKYKEAKNLEINISDLQEENEALKSEIEYFKNPANLEKEARSVLNYKKTGEKLAIIIEEIQEFKKEAISTTTSGLKNKLWEHLLKIFNFQ